MSSETLIPWGAITGAINRQLPEWGRYKGHGTYALGAYAYSALATVIAYGLYSGGSDRLALGFAGFALVLALLGDYHRKAAKLRVECSNCGEDARGQDECPHCGELTFMEESA